MTDQAKIGVINLETGEVAHLTTKDGVTVDKGCHCLGRSDGFTGTFKIGIHKIIIENGFILVINNFKTGEFI